MRKVLRNKRAQREKKAGGVGGSREGKVALAVIGTREASGSLVSRRS